MFKKKADSGGNAVKINFTELKNKNINLLPESILKQRRSRQSFSLIVLFLALIFGLFSFYMGRLSVETKALLEETENAKGKIEEYSNLKENQKIVLFLEDQINFKKGLVDSIFEKNTSIIKILNSIDMNLPFGLKYTNISSNSQQNIIINGFAEDYRSVATLIYNLKETNLFKDVFLQDANKNVFIYAEDGKEEVRYNFSVVCDFGGEDDEN